MQFYRKLLKQCVYGGGVETITRKRALIYCIINPRMALKKNIGEKNK